MARLDPSELLRRELSFSEAKPNEDDRSVELSFSSELPVARGDYDEVLAHDPEHMDLSRLNNAHPLLLNHDSDKQIGVVEKARLDADKKGRAIVRFSRSQLGDEIWKDVKDGIRRLVSVGYRRTKEVSSEKSGDREVVRFAWQPYEISIVSVPADASVGIGRSEPQPEAPKQKVEIVMADNQPNPVADERTRVKEIRAAAKLMTGKIPGISELADRAIDGDMSIDQFRAEALKLVPTPEAAPRVEPLNVPARDISKYSISRAIARIADQKGLDGIERELNDELTKRQGSPKGMFWLPHEAMATRALLGQGVATASLGGNLKATELWSSEFIPMLQNKMLVGRLGPRVISGLSGDIAIPRGYHSSVASWKTEVAAAVISDFGIQQLSLTPKGVTAKTGYSKQLLIQGNPSIDMLLRDDMLTQIALAIDLAALHGAGSGEPTGIYNTTDVNLVTLGSGDVAFTTMGVTAYESLVSLETAIAVDNADVAGMAFVTNPKVKGQLRAAPMNTNAATFVWTNGSEPGVGELIGYRAFATNQVYSDRTIGSNTTSSSIFFGDWSQLILAYWGAGVDVLVDPYTQAGTREVLIYASQYADVGARHPQSFAILQGINAG